MTFIPVNSSQAWQDYMRGLGPFVKMDGPAIVANYTNDKMVARPEFYSGYGASFENCGSNHLQGIFEGVKKEWGDEAAKAFVQLVYQMDDLAPTRFLLTFYAFVENGCKLVKTAKTKIAHEGTRDGGATAFASVMTAMSPSGERNETESIRRDFLFKHKGEYFEDKVLEDQRHQKRQRSSNRYGYFGE